jgi:hypothetical protein
MHNITRMLRTKRTTLHCSLPIRISVQHPGAYTKRRTRRTSQQGLVCTSLLTVRRGTCEQTHRKYRHNNTDRGPRRVRPVTKPPIHNRERRTHITRGSKVRKTDLMSPTIPPQMCNTNNTTRNVHRPTTQNRPHTINWNL